MITVQDFLNILEAMASKIKDKKDILNQLDAEIGDGDHGDNLISGMERIQAKILSWSVRDIGTILKIVGATLVSKVKGASGPLYGVAFMKAGQVIGNQRELNAMDFQQMLLAAIDGIKTKGKVQRGEKTIIDALEPAYIAFVAAFEEGDNVTQALNKAVQAAYQGVEQTKNMIATKGRASELGEKSLGYQDPGATSAYFLLESIAESLEGGNVRWLQKKYTNLS